MNSKIFGIALVATLIVTIFNATSVISLKKSQQTATVYSGVVNSVRPTTGSPSPSGLTAYSVHCTKTSGPFLSPNEINGTTYLPGDYGTFNTTFSTESASYDCTLTPIRS